MMTIKTDISVPEFFSYTLMVFGVFLDHVTTYLGLNHGLFESNVWVNYCLDAGVWLLLDFTLVSGVAVTSYFIAHASKGGKLDRVMLFPFVFGVVRLAAAIWNLNIIC